MQKSSESVGGG